MKLLPFLLDRWVHDHEDPPPEFNLAGSAGPHWTIGEVLDLDEGSRNRLFGTDLVYGPRRGRMDLRAAIARMQGVDAEHVLVVAGASEALLHVFFLAAEPGANVIVPFPGFPPYAAIPQALGLEVRHYHLRPENDYHLDFDEVGSLVDGRTTLLLVNSPHNPTGATLSDEEMRRLHDVATDRGIQFVVDEVFHPIYHGTPSASAAGLPNATVLGDLSKAFALSGLRLGWIVEPNAERRAQYLNARQYFTISNTSSGELIAEIAVRHRETIWNRTRHAAHTNVRRLDAFVAEQNGRLDWRRPQGGMTCFVRLIGANDARPFCEAAARQGVLLVPGDCFGVPDHFRLGFGVNAETFPPAMKRFATFLNAWDSDSSRLSRAPAS